jgi:hypothetical protein
VAARWRYSCRVEGQVLDFLIRHSGGQQ